MKTKKILIIIAIIVLLNLIIIAIELLFDIKISPFFGGVLIPVLAGLYCSYPYKKH